MSEMIAGAPADPLWDATSVFLPEYADVLLADGVCGRMLPVTEDGWFGFSKDQPGLEQLTSGNRDPFVVDVRRVLHGMYPSENASGTSLLLVRLVTAVASACCCTCVSSYSLRLNEFPQLWMGITPCRQQKTRLGCRTAVQVFTARAASY